MIWLSHLILRKDEFNMSKAQELISVLSEEEVIARASFAKATRVCKICGEPAIFFKTPREELEYSISMICQSCQDYYFPKEHWISFPNYPGLNRSMQGRSFLQSSSIILTRIGKQACFPSGQKLHHADFNEYSFSFTGRHKICCLKKQRKVTATHRHGIREANFECENPDKSLSCELGIDARDIKNETL